MKFKKILTKIPELIHIEPVIYSDSRGYFLETYSNRDLTQIGINVNFVQDNESKSTKGVVRGLHFQTKNTQGKLVRCIKGKVLDVAVDLRKESPTYKQWDSVVLDGEKKNMLYIPEGFAHGFLVISDEAVFTYKCTEYYSPEYDGGIRWNDPDIGILWNLSNFGIKQPNLSDKDKNLPFLKDIDLNF